MISFFKNFTKIKNLTKGYYFSFFILLIFSLLNVFIEMLSIGIIIPLIEIILKSQNNSFQLNYFENILDFKQIETKSILVFSSLFILLLFIFKSFFLIFFGYYQSNLIYRVNLQLSNNLMNSYLKQNYIFFITKQSSEILRNITSEISVSMSYINAALNLFIETIIVIGIFFILLYFQTQITLIIFLIILIFLFFYIFFLQTKISSWGKIRQKSELKTIDIVQQGFGGIIEITILNCQKYFLNIFYNYNKQNLITGRNMNIISVLPRSLLELLAIIIITIIIFLNIFLYDMNNLLTSLPLFAVAFFRILPSANKIINTYQTLKFSHPSINLIDKEMQILKKNIIHKNFAHDNKTLSFNSNINLNDISFGFNDKKIIKDLNLKINKHEFVGIYGESGSGKTTFLNIFLGLISPKQGSIKVDNVNIEKNLIKWRNNISYTSQNFFIAPVTIKQNIAFGIEEDKIDSFQLDYAIKNSELQNLIDELPSGINTIVEEGGVNLSGGQRQRLAIARSLYFDRKIIVMDEATSSLDKTTEFKIYKNLKKLKNKTILVVTHNLEIKKFCDRVLNINNGNISQEI
tara:strand:+ start:3891 stop:5618 length:1728 start_codon:yes stop_codon:yes gene_type:complete